MKVAVIGAGLAGLAAACELADLGHRVMVFEQRPWAGGKTYSFTDPETGTPVDNGQHVFMACTTEYVSFLRRLGTLRLTRRQRRMRVPVLDPDGRRSDLFAVNLPPPVHLAPSFALFRHLGAGEKLSIARVLEAVRHVDPVARSGLNGTSFADWLRQRGQSATVIEKFWDFLMVPTLNCRTEAASAEAALFVLQEGFLASNRSAAVGVPGVGLSELHVGPAVAYIEAHGGEVSLGSEVRQLGACDGWIDSVEVAGGKREGFDAFVCAVPHTRLARLLPPGSDPELLHSIVSLPTSPIINLHFWFDWPVAPFSFAAFVGCDLQWVFNRRRLDLEAGASGEHLVVSLSAAEAYMPLDKGELRERFLPQLQRALPRIGEARRLRYTAIKEPEATFVPAPGVKRPGPTTEFPNLVLAGAYTNTGWPATMESAVRSGLIAARTLNNRSSDLLRGRLARASQ